MLFQLSNTYTIKKGDFDGRISLKSLKTKGDFGIGTFDRLDGEMVELDGIIYQIKSDGRVYLIQDSIKTPFATVTFFVADEGFDISGCGSYRELAEFIGSRVADKDAVYAVKLEGDFDYLKLRSPHPQDKPYKTLEDALKTQGIFELTYARGFLVGFWFPAYMGELNTAGVHFHFITSDRKRGGHLLEGKFGSLKMSLCRIKEFDMLLDKRPSGSGK